MGDKRRMASHRVVIVGGGFGGLIRRAAARPATRASAVTLVDRRNYHLFQPLLYQVATGALAPGEIAQPLRSILRRNRNTTVLLGEAVGIDPERREVAPVGRRPDPVRHAGRRDRARASRTSATTTGRRSRRASSRSTTRPRSGAGSSSPSRPPSASTNPERRRRVDDVRGRRWRPDRRRAGRRARRDRPRHAPPRLPVDPPARRPDHPRRGARPDPADLPARSLGLGAAPARDGSGWTSGRGPGSSTSTTATSGSHGGRSRGADPDPDRPVGGRRAGLELRPGGRRGARAPRWTGRAGSSSGPT